jgi:uncharacterized protein DUF2510
MDVVVLVVLFLILLALLGLMVTAVVYLIGTAVGSREESVALEYELPTATGLGVVVDEVWPVMQSARYELSWRDESVACFERSYRPVWRIIIAILLLPLGLLLLLWTRTDSVVFQLLIGAGGSRLAVGGRMSHHAQDQLQETLGQLGEARRVAGWYPDGSSTERYWDGEAWTARSRGERVVVGPRMSSGPRS